MGAGKRGTELRGVRGGKQSCKGVSKVNSVWALKSRSTHD